MDFNSISLLSNSKNVNILHLYTWRTKYIMSKKFLFSAFKNVINEQLYTSNHFPLQDNNVDGWLRVFKISKTDFECPFVIIPALSKICIISMIGSEECKDQGCLGGSVG